MSTSSIDFLYSLERFGIKLGLRNISLLVESLGHPERRFPSIHIAGTNGKGSAACMLASILTAAGYRTGLYTSPHLVDFSERIRIDGRTISGHELAFYIEALRPLIVGTSATFFEATTAIAFQYFADEKVDVAVIETGLGGRFDATNILAPCLSMITSIGIDHVAQLGSTTASIAYEKAGIIKRGIPVIAGSMDVPAAGIIRRTADDLHAPLINVEDSSSTHVRRRSLAVTSLDFHSARFQLDRVSLPLAGDFQVENVRNVLSAIPILRGCGFHMNDEDIRRGLRHVRKNSGLRGRFEVLTSDPPVIADVAHNADAMLRLSATLRGYIPGKCITLIGLMKDKEVAPVVEAISRVTRVGVAVRPSTPRAMDPSLLQRHFQKCEKRAIIGGSVSEGLDLARAIRRDGEPIVITGSHYVVGEVMQFS